jgi:HK97 family phage portal protein
MDMIGMATSSKENVSPDKALTLSAYFAGVRVISEDVGKLPCILYTQDSKGDKERFKESKLWPVITRRPNPFMSSQQFRELMVQWAIGWGGAVAEIQRSVNGEAIGLWPIHPSRVGIERESIGQEVKRWYWVRQDNGSKVRIADENIIHIRGFGDIDNGYGVAAYMSETIGHGIAAKRFGSAFLGNAMRPSGVLQANAPMKPETETNFREQWTSWYAGTGNVGKTPIIPQGIEYKSISINPDEAQYIETCKFSVVEIARALRVNPNKIQDWERSTFNNMEQANTDHVVDTLMPWLVRIEQEFTFKLFGADGDIFVEHLVDALLRGDMASRGEYVQKQIRNGILSINEARRMDNRNSVEGGDMYYVTRDLIPVDQVGLLPQAQPVPAVPAAEPTHKEDKKSVDAMAIFRPTFHAIVHAEMSKEMKAVERMQKKHGLKTAEFAAAVAAFFSEQESHYAGKLKAPLAGYFELLRTAIDPQDITIRIGCYCNEAVRQIAASETNEALAAILDPAAWADGFIDDLLYQNEVPYKNEGEQNA